jgi:hypothetical protein
MIMYTVIVIKISGRVIESIVFYMLVAFQLVGVDDGFGSGLWSLQLPTKVCR